MPDVQRVAREGDDDAVLGRLAVLVDLARDDAVEGVVTRREPGDTHGPTLPTGVASGPRLPGTSGHVALLDRRVRTMLTSRHLPRARHDDCALRTGAPGVDAPHLARRQAGQKHPVHDFLFTYYSFSPAKLMTWQPGLAAERDGRGPRPAAAADRGHQDDSLVATASRPAAHRLLRPARVGDGAPHRRDPPRRPAAPRRSGHRRRRRVAPDRLLALRRLPLLHPDGAPDERAVARPRRPGGVRAAGLPARDDGPLQARVPALAAGRLRPRRRLLRARVGRPRGRHARVALRLHLWGFEPIKIETAEGKRAYAAHQRAFADRAAPLRSRLVEACDLLLSAAL